jgi:carbon monoxide dehydrogenase subunit G
MRLVHVFEVARPTEDVFAYLADVTNEAKWNPWAKWVRRLDEGPIGPGAVFRGSYQGFGELDQDLTDYEPPRRLTYHSVPKGMRDARMTFELEPAGGSTKVTVTGVAQPAGVMKLMEPVMSLRMRPHLRDVEEGIKRELEGAPASPPRA